MSRSMWCCVLCVLAVLSVNHWRPNTLLRRQSQPWAKVDGKPADMSKRVQVYILLGQSNMLGMGKIAGDKDGSPENAANGTFLDHPVAGDEIAVVSHRPWTVRRRTPL